VRRLLPVLAATLLAASCGGEETAGGNAERISRADFGNDWPFTVEEGTLGCDDSQGGPAVTFEAAGTVYGVNGFAKTYGYKDIEPIWRDSSDPLAGPKVNIGPIIDRGLELCNQ
jgi:hypothetical protein